MAVSSYTPYGLPLFEVGTGGEDSADNGMKEWLDAQLRARENLIMSGDSFVKSGEAMVYLTLIN